MKILSASQIRELDLLTISEENILSADLMERAAVQLFKWISGKFDRSRRFIILAGPGNNGGDGLALARMLAENRYDVEVFFVKLSDSTSGDWNHNRERLINEAGISMTTIDDTDKFPLTGQGDIIVDAIFGSGLNRPVTGPGAGIIKKINQSGCTVISVDIPSGLFCEDNSSNTPGTIVRADHTLSFQLPKLSFLLPDTGIYAGEWHILPIGLSSNGIQNMTSDFEYIEEANVS